MSEAFGLRVEMLELADNDLTDRLQRELFEMGQRNEQLKQLTQMALDPQ